MDSQTWYDIAGGQSGAIRGFAEWLDRCATLAKLSDKDIAERYASLKHLIRGDDGRRRDRRESTPQPTQINKWRTGKVVPKTGVVAYRMGRAFEEAGLPVNGLDGLIAGHYLCDLLGVVGAHISITIKEANPDYIPPIEEVDDILLLFKKLKKCIARELAVRKIELGSDNMDVEELSAIYTPLPIGELYNAGRRKLIDAGFCAWAYDKEATRQQLPPSFAAAISLLTGNPTPELVDLAAQVLRDPANDILALFGLGTPAWVQRIIGDLPEPSFNLASPRIPTEIDKFFDEYESDFHELPPLLGNRQSPRYPGVMVRLGILHFDGGASSAISINWIIVNNVFSYRNAAKDVIEYLQHLAAKHNVLLATLPTVSYEENSKCLQEHGFSVCQSKDFDEHRRLEWPKCPHVETLGS
ncbi:MAG: hypothetical protein ACYDCA_01595 [Candidatus Tyrphobacter sp.]